MTTALWWIRRDLRLSDNQALTAALDHATRIVPVFVLDPFLLETSPYVGEKRKAFLFEGLRVLDAALQARGSRLIVRHGRPEATLEKLLDESGADTIFAEADVSPYAQRRDRRVADRLPLQLTSGLIAHPPDAVRRADGGFYVVYSPYRRRWSTLTPPMRDDLAPAPDRLPAPEVESDEIPGAPVLPDSVPFPPGEREARRRLKVFAEEKMPDYDEGRDRMDQDATSRLSPYLRFGMLSVREAIVTAREAASQGAERGARTWLDELVWREFYGQILYHHPRVRRGSFREKYQGLAWKNDEADFEAWREGTTGYPVVDAGMRQLRASGWMHNRARMIVASFLTKDLLINWQWGERYFMQQLVDGDPAANNGGWQWAAGTGTDAAPYFRIFNPVSQGKKHDPEGDYVRRWVPELEDVPLEYVHEPWTMPHDVQQAAGCVIGEDYPVPIVDHSEARERTLVAYRRAAEEN